MKKILITAVAMFCTPSLSYAACCTLSIYPASTCNANGGVCGATSEPVQYLCVAANTSTDCDKARVNYGYKPCGKIGDSCKDVSVSYAPGGKCTMVEGSYVCLIEPSAASTEEKNF